MRQKRYHIIVDLQDVAVKKIEDLYGLRIFLTAFPEKIGMHILKGPVLAHGIAENPGISGFVIIDYSHISVHTFAAYHEALIDVFSCKPYDKETVIAEVLRYFAVDLTKAKIKEVSWGE